MNTISGKIIFSAWYLVKCQGHQHCKQSLTNDSRCKANPLIRRRKFFILCNISLDHKLHPSKWINLSSYLTELRVLKLRTEWILIQFNKFRVEFFIVKAGIWDTETRKTTTVFKKIPIQWLSVCQYYYIGPRVDRKKPNQVQQIGLLICFQCMFPKFLILRVWFGPSSEPLRLSFFTGILLLLTVKPAKEKGSVPWFQHQKIVFFFFIITSLIFVLIFNYFRLARVSCLSSTSKLFKNSASCFRRKVVVF